MMDRLSWLLDIVKEAEENAYKTEIKEVDDIEYTLLQSYFIYGKDGFSIVVRRKGKSSDYLLELPVQSLYAEITDADRLVFKTLNSLDKVELEILIATPNSTTKIASVLSTKCYVGADASKFIPDSIESFVNRKLTQVKEISPKLQADYGFIFNTEFLGSVEDIMELVNDKFTDSLSLAVTCDEVEGGDNVYFWNKDRTQEGDKCISLGVKRIYNFCQNCYNKDIDYYRFNFYIMNKFGTRVLISTYKVPGVCGLIYYLSNLQRECYRLMSVVKTIERDNR